MNKVFLTILVLSATLATSSACMNHVATQPQPTASTSGFSANQTSEDAQFIDKLSELRRKNPVADAQAAIASDERYFLCNIGRSSTVPGIDPAAYASARQHCPTQCLDGVTDAILGDNHMNYLQVAVEYSANWNKVMIAACQ